MKKIEILMNIKSNKIKAKLAILFTTCLCLLVLIKISSWWSELNENLVLKHIIISNTSMIDNKEYHKLVDQFLGYSLDELIIGDISQILEEHPYVKASRVSKWFPSTIRIELIERKPIAILNIPPIVLLDKDGFVLPNKQSKTNFNLPILNKFNPDSVLYPYGDKVLSINVENCIYWLGKIKMEYPTFYEDISEMKMTSDNDINIILSEYPTNIYLGKNDIWSKINILKKFENELYPKKLSDFSYLDMRYNNQVIAKNRAL